MKAKLDKLTNRKRIFTEDVITDRQNKKNILIEDKSFYLLPNNFNIILLIDTQETSR
jgi:hypothetical protein